MCFGIGFELMYDIVCLLGGKLCINWGIKNGIVV